MCGWQVLLCDPLVTHRPYRSALKMIRDSAIQIYVYLTSLITISGGHANEDSRLLTVKREDMVQYGRVLRRVVHDHEVRLRMKSTTAQSGLLPVVTLEYHRVETGRSWQLDKLCMTSLSLHQKKNTVKLQKKLYYI